MTIVLSGTARQHRIPSAAEHLRGEALLALQPDGSMRFALDRT